MLDSADKKILTLLQQDGRMTSNELSAKVHLSPSACHRRVQQLEKAGVIERYAAILNPEAVEKGATVFVEIVLMEQGLAVLEAFERAASRHSEILECYLMTGNMDYLLKIAVRDNREYEDIHREILTRLPHVSRIRSSFALKPVRRQAGYDLGADLPK